MSGHHMLYPLDMSGHHLLYAVSLRFAGPALVSSIALLGAFMRADMICYKKKPPGVTEPQCHTAAFATARRLYCCTRAAAAACVLA